MADTRGAVARDSYRETPQERLGGARADFVANLGRRIAELSTTLQGLEVDPGSVRLRDDMRRRIHALSAGAKLLRFGRLADELSDCERVLDGAAERMGALLPAELLDLRALLECAPALAWGQASVDATRERPRDLTISAASPAPSSPSAVPESMRAPAGSTAALEPAVDAQIVLVVGAPELADAITLGLTDGVETSATSGGFEVERTDDATAGIDLARALAPDIALVDADRPGARELVAALTQDPLTEPIPIIAVGTWSRPEDAAPFVALGVARALAKPVSPDAIRRACVETLATYVRREVKRSPLGELTLDDLGARLSEEINRGICDAAQKGRGDKIDLGEGNEVLAAVWGAVARIRDLVTIRSNGGVRFAPSGPEGALPIAPWLAPPESGDGRAAKPSEARTATAPSLDDKTIVVADDDPAVTWFLAGVLKAAGAKVYEARDGARALELAFQHAPDLVISDVLMPNLDGFALCRALKRDLVLRDVPVILLSWKEDLLQRVRELGASADGYLRKEATASSIVQRVREVLRGRHRVAERLAAGGEVRGRLDGLTARTLLHLVCEARPDSRVSLRDATFLYEIEIRDGRPARATRTSESGTFQRGPSVLSALLGVGTGRFVVASANDREGTFDLFGTLDEQLEQHVASARAAQRLLSGADLVQVERVEIDESRMDAYAPATPEPARSLLRAVASGASPRLLITTGQASATLLEDIFADAAAHGAISGVTSATGEDLLFPAIEREVRVLRGVKPPPKPLPEPVLDLGPVQYTSTPAPVEVIEAVTPEPEVRELPTMAPVTPEAKVIIAPSATSVVAPAPAPDLFGPDEEEEEIVVDVEPSKPIPMPAPPPAPVPIVAKPVEKPAPVPVPRMPSRPTLGSLTPPPVAPRIEVLNADAATASVRPPSAYLPESAKEKAPKKEASNRSMWLLFAVAGIVFAVGARLARERDTTQTTPVQAPETHPTVEATAAPLAAPAEPATLRGDGETRADPVMPLDQPLRADDKVPPGQGMIEVVAGSSDAIAIDGVSVGNGPIVKRALAPRKEPYEVHVKVRGDDRIRFVSIKEGRLTRLRVAAPWSR